MSQREKITWIGLIQERANAQQHARQRERRAPLVAQYVDADVTVAGDVGVVNLGDEFDLWRLKWIVRREIHVLRSTQ